MYRLASVGKSYGPTSVLVDISCHIPSDKFVFVMGPSGSGKSTLLRLLSFVEWPTSGTIALDVQGRHFESTGRARPWPTVTAVFQKQFLWPHLTLRENIDLPLRTANIPDGDARIKHVIERFDMAQFVDRYPNEVSGGQAQRAALARAFALQPRVILIDEAHVGLDLEQQDALNTYLLALRQDGVGLILVTHSLAFARKFADTVVVVESGRIAEIGDRSIFDVPTSGFLRRVKKYEAATGGD